MSRCPGRTPRLPGGRLAKIATKGHLLKTCRLQLQASAWHGEPRETMASTRLGTLSEASSRHASTRDRVASDGLFFAFACYYFCGEDGGEDVCNLPLKHVAGFAHTFECGPDSPMNPERKCSILV
ncbi:hypothetical protein HPB51_011872 [Rhipicephalus microplus]|uniref:Uncharacterized protein n=1 Tax=Rhipicephalus microplus TaxID=6941 RepID=A0A9J6E966_RHIMP|nr:hypothetical protein HPB51_011872 [Rhipicephalus microplus]